MRLSVAPLFINFNHSKIALPVSSAPPVLDVAGLDLALQGGHERIGAYFLSAFSAAIARVAASITSLGALAMPSL